MNEELPRILHRKETIARIGRENRLPHPNGIGYPAAEEQDGPATAVVDAFDDRLPGEGRALVGRHVLAGFAVDALQFRIGPAQRAHAIARIRHRQRRRFEGMAGPDAVFPAERVRHIAGVEQHKGHQAFGPGGFEQPVIVRLVARQLPGSEHHRLGIGRQVHHERKRMGIGQDPGVQPRLAQRIEIADHEGAVEEPGVAAHHGLFVVASRRHAGHRIPLPQAGVLKPRTHAVGASRPIRCISTRISAGSGASHSTPRSVAG